MRKFMWAAAAVVALATAACSTLGAGAFRQPVVNLHDVRVRGLGLQGGSLDVLLSVYNPNGYRLDASQLNYRVSLDGDSVTLASGTLNNRFTVQDKDSSIVTIPVNFTYSGIGAAGRQIMAMGAVNYHVAGSVVVNTLVGNFTVPFSQVGRFTTTGIGR